MKRSPPFIRGLRLGFAAGFFQRVREGLIGRAAHGARSPPPSGTNFSDSATGGLFAVLFNDI
jgi:hypothetical protein